MSKRFYFIVFFLIIFANFRSLANSTEPQGVVTNRWESLDAMAEDLSALSGQISMSLDDGSTVKSSFGDFEAFQHALVTAMVTDPVYNENRAAVSEHALQLTAELKKNFSTLKSLQDVANRLGVANDFQAYVKTVDSVIRAREERRYSVARARLKELMLSGVFDRLNGVAQSSQKMAQSAVLNKLRPEVSALLASLANMQNVLALLKSESLRYIATFDKNEQILKQNVVLGASLANQVYWIDRLSWFVAVSGGMACGLGLFLFLQSAVPRVARLQDSLAAVVEKSVGAVRQSAGIVFSVKRSLANAFVSLKARHTARLSALKIKKSAKVTKVEVLQEVRWTLREHLSEESALPVFAAPRVESATPAVAAIDESQIVSAPLEVAAAVIVVAAPAVVEILSPIAETPAPVLEVVVPVSVSPAQTVFASMPAPAPIPARVLNIISPADESQFMEEIFFPKAALSQRIDVPASEPKPLLKQIFAAKKDLRPKHEFARKRGAASKKDSIAQQSPRSAPTESRQQEPKESLWDRDPLKDIFEGLI